MLRPDNAAGSHRLQVFGLTVSKPLDSGNIFVSRLIGNYGRFTIDFSCKWGIVIFMGKYIQQDLYRKIWKR